MNLLFALFLPLLARLQTGFAGPPAPSPPPVTQLPGGAAAEQTDRVATRVALREKERAQLAAQVAERSRAYEGQLRRIDELKRGRPSWRRDRQVKKHLAESLAMARGLAALDRRVQAIDRDLASLRRAVLEAIERELDGGVTDGDRRRRLARLRALALDGLQRRKIVLADETIDPLADPEELDDQAARLRQSERDLAGEIERLAARARRYRHMSRLQRKAHRASELSHLDDDRPRRSSAPLGAAAGARAHVPENFPTAPLGDSFAGGAPAPRYEESDPTFVLADVIDSTTLDALRRAGESDNPLEKALAAERVQAEVKARLERLRARRSSIEKRAEMLRRQQR